MVPDRVVSPRTCGGTSMPRPFSITSLGLPPPPRLRGNRPAAQGGLGALGYPRACGETTIRCCAWRPNRGLSRLRGNQADRPRALHRLGSIPHACGGTQSTHSLARLEGGSIPAHAGEPPPSRSCPRTSRVYPRACGGTALEHFRERVVGGLSPRMRGNRQPHARRGVGVGSIPAHAGEPPLCRKKPR